MFLLGLSPTDPLVLSLPSIMGTLIAGASLAPPSRPGAGHENFLKSVHPLSMLSLNFHCFEVGENFSSFGGAFIDGSVIYRDPRC